MRVLGLDPGSRACGWGLVTAEGSSLSAEAFGTWRLGTGRTTERLRRLFEGAETALSRLHPEAVAIEAVFTGKSAASAAALAQARGVLLLAAARAGVPCYDYEPLLVKKTVTGYGLADKRQVRAVVRMLLPGMVSALPLDAADALAVAICHCHHAQSPGFDPCSGAC